MSRSKSTPARLLTLIAASMLLLNLTARAETVPPPCPAMADGAPTCECASHPHRGGNGMEFFERLDTALGLSDTQKQELGALLEMYRPRIKELAERGVNSSQALFTVAPDDPAYNTRAAELSQLAGSSATEMVTLLAELQSNAYALLTREQQAKFMELRAEQRARMETMREQMRERRANGDWQPGMHMRHHMGDHACTPMPGEVDTAPAASD